jgi:hypothetical protein
MLEAAAGNILQQVFLKAFLIFICFGLSGTVHVNDLYLG